MLWLLIAIPVILLLLVTLIGLIAVMTALCYCSNMARAGMNPKTLQYLMGHSDIGVTMNTYTHLGLEDAKDEMIRLEELNQAKKEIEKTERPKELNQNMFRVI